MKQTQKLNALISKIIKEELDNIKEESKINYKKIPDEEAVKILNNNKYDIETTVDYDYEYREPATDILMSGDIKANSFDKIGAKEIRLSVYKPGATDPFFLSRKAGSWTVGMFAPNIKEEEKEYVTSDGTSKTVTSQQKQSISKAKAGDTVKYRKAGMGTTSTTQGALEENEEEMQEPDMEQKPKASEIAGQLAEIMEKLKSMAEGEDPKKGKHAAKVMKYMESAKAALEALTAHETMLEEKDQAEQEKKAEKHRKNVEKIFKGIVKDENIVNRLKDKLSTKDIAALSKKLGEKGKELDEEKLARIVLNRSLKEGWVKKK
jgi:hypothetical protein